MSKPTLFISHITEESKIAAALKVFLERRFLNVISVFASSHEESIRMGDDWMYSIKESMKDCQLLIVICSPISIVRPWINFEAGAGWLKGIPVIPLCHSGLTPGKLPVPLNSFQGGLLNNPDDIKKMFARIAGILSLSTPDSKNNTFFTTINSFEYEIKSTTLIKDTTFVNNLLNTQIEYLKESIVAPTKREEMVNFRRPDNFLDYKFTFNHITSLFDTSTLFMYLRQKNYMVFHDIVQKLSENVKLGTLAGKRTQHIT